MEMAPSEPDGDGSLLVTDLHHMAVPAEAERLPELRHALVEWARHAGTTDEQVEMLTLACYEALANVAAHAYPEGTGVLDLHAIRRRDPARIEVMVRDYGRWQQPRSSNAGPGGRGLVLLRSLADHAEVTSDDSGTTVSMTWNLVSDTAARPP
ncbi:anti-sigma regulatory factor (Ser/Thr protein kinase) [Saccharopolyspora lacisalsi]|uniref:Anti-sigma regulatory factor (Ser/Thr protein kinase) n=1 Tax=Halosaccharopolyspora lacisalsi TaxID=1000566 RepID=A0A839E6N4_9PSEU|nr:ATP-binding protein [Halosaccharopolyspora lacisalsi]MBA8827555.1 anti-sigma regulatory factor (Ser/Thr protein kinase) [Halosaccharopolyspora lacisalsi]